MTVKITITVQERTKAILDSLPKDFNLSGWTDKIYNEYFSNESIILDSIDSKKKEIEKLEKELSLIRKYCNNKNNKIIITDYDKIDEKTFIKRSIKLIKENPGVLLNNLVSYNTIYNKKLTKMQFLQLLDEVEKSDLK